MGRWSGEKGEVVVKIQLEILTTDERFSDADGTIKLSLNKSGKYLIRSFKTGYQEEVILYQPSKDGAENTIVMNPLPEAEPVKGKNLSTCLLRQLWDLYLCLTVFLWLQFFLSQRRCHRWLKYHLWCHDSQTWDEDQLSAHTDARAMHFTINNYQNKGQRLPKIPCRQGYSSQPHHYHWFGESRIRNHCKDSVTCTEDEHLFNRRTEVLILEWLTIWQS